MSYWPVIKKQTLLETEIDIQGENIWVHLLKHWEEMKSKINAVSEWVYEKHCKDLQEKR